MYQADDHPLRGSHLIDEIAIEKRLYPGFPGYNLFLLIRNFAATVLFVFSLPKDDAEGRCNKKTGHKVPLDWRRRWDSAIACIVVDISTF
jgi:hypothetical protein